MCGGSGRGCNQWHRRIAGLASPSASLPEWLDSTVAGALGIGLLVWVGAYFGACFSPPYRRNERLVWLAIIAFGVLGVLLSLPIRTHAVRLDTPAAGDASAAQFMPLLVPLALIAAVVLASVFITRALTAVSGSRVACQANRVRAVWMPDSHKRCDFARGTAAAL